MRGRLRLRSILPTRYWECEGEEERVRMLPVPLVTYRAVMVVATPPELATST